MRRGVRLGVDVGSVRVGVASCDPDGLIATPLQTVQRAKDGSDVAVVAALAAEHSAIEVIVGLPRSLDGAERAAAEGARSWAKALRRHTPQLSVRLVDERMTTVDAHRALDATGVSHRNRRSIIDQQAAVLILQVALDSERVSGEPAGEAVGGRKPRRKSGPNMEGRQ
ncbi:Holliday junction resolvase RuvX [Flexivirga meconopsidis]|uniref:Holliday junction resolvase RuvX n=1 Tax=Flexivirga meconopsidis TaxID=2977121 RepID=UPI00223F3A49|nr:Holliday junction resolvase RuvX [Flexivirga meconopsidis]